MEILSLRTVLDVECQMAAGPTLAEELQRRAAVWLVEKVAGTLVFEEGAEDVVKRIISSPPHQQSL